MRARSLPKFAFLQALALLHLAWALGCRGPAPAPPAAEPPAAVARAAAAAPPHAAAAPDPAIGAASPWEEAIRAFEEADRRSPPPGGAVLFVGSSSIRLWSLAESFPDLAVINRGFGGSQLADSVRFAPRIVTPSRPRIVVLYAGDNDIAAGKAAETVLADFKAFAAAVHAALPATRIVFLSIKPSPARWHLVGEMRRANDLIRASAAADARLAFVDVAAPMLGKDGKPRPELYAADGLHLNAEGYMLWASLLRPILAKEARVQ